MDRTVVPADREQLSAWFARGERYAIPLGFLITLAILIVVFYYPVGRVFVAALLGGGDLFSPLLAVLSDPFYFGVAHSLFRDPFGVPGGVYSWITAGMPPVSFGLFGFTAYQAVLSTIASVLLGLPGAYVLARFEFPGRRTIRSLTILPFVLPGIMVAVGFLAMFGQQGLFNDLLAAVGFGRVELLYSLQIIIVAHAFYNAPLVTRLVTTAWESVDARRIETARTMGASPTRAFWDVVRPQLQPALLTGALLTFIFTFMSFPIILALGGLQLATVEFWLYTRVQNLELQEAAALGAIETTITLGLTYLYLRYEAKQLGSRDAESRLPRKPLWAGRTFFADPLRLSILAYGLVVLVVFVGPLVSLVVESLTTPAGQFTTAYYEFLLDRQAAAASGTTKPLPAIVNSLVFGGGTLLLSVPMGLVVAVVATRGGRGSRAGESILTAPIAVSGVVVGVGLLQALVFGSELFGTRITATGPVVIVFAHAVAAYPFVTRNVAPALGSLDANIADAARSLGASRVRALADVELPLVTPAVLAGAAFAFAISIGEFDSTVLLAEGVESYTMPVALERYVGMRSLGPNLGPATAMGTVLLAITATSFVVIDRLGGRWEP